VLGVLLLLAVFVSCTGQEKKAERSAKSGPAKRVLIISLDGLDARYLQKRDEYGLKIPALRRLMAEGATARGVTAVYPSVTYPSHTTIVTGVLPSRHGIFGNELFEPPGTERTGGWHWFARDIRAETLWDVAARNNLKVGMVSWPVGGGAGDFNVPEILAFGKPLHETVKLMKANQRPQGLIEEVESRDPQLYLGANKDEQDDMRTRFAEHLISEKRPDVMLVHLFDLDHFQHDYGPFTPEAFAMLEKVDGYVGRMLAAASRAGTLAETAVFIVSDHGFLPVSKLVHPGVLLSRAGLIQIREEKDEQNRARAVVTDWRAYPYVTAGSCAIILRDAKDEETLKKLRSLFGPLAGREGSGILRVLEAKEVRALGADPNAALMLEAADGYSFGKETGGEAITSNPQRGQHGFLPTRADYYASFIASGAGIGRRGDLGIVRMIDLGPTIAHTLGLNLRQADGRAIKGMKDEEKR
jgi:predicted AlkP superfamily pyrophosphatase or phosphodiesterase